MTAVTARLGGRRLLFAFALAAVGAGAGRALTTTYLPVLLERIEDAPTLIGVVMMVNAIAGFGVPIAVGIWSDRRGRRLPYITGGAVLTAGGLVAVGLGNGTSYVVLGLAASLVYVGLNALTTAHRAIIADDIEDSGRPAATSAQEIAGLVGAVVAVALGGALIEPAPAAAFALAAGVLAATAVPTVLVTRRLRLGERPAHADADEPAAGLRELARQPGAREVLIAQTMWVFGYAALPAFFVLYAERSLGLGVGAAGALPLAFGVLTALGIVLAGRAPAERVHSLLVTGAIAAGGRAAGGRSRDEPACGRARIRGGGGRCGHRDGARLPLLRALRAGGPGRALQRRVLRRTLGCLRCRAPARRTRGRADRQLPGRAVVRGRRPLRRGAARGGPASVSRARAARATYAASRARERRRRDPRVRVRPRGRGGEGHAQPRGRDRPRGRRRTAGHLTLARRTRRRRSGAHPSPRLERGQGERCGGGRLAPALRPDATGGNRHARFRRPARAHAHSGVRRGERERRRRDRPPPRAPLDATDSQDRATVPRASRCSPAPDPGCRTPRTACGCSAARR